jgi:hypothetical protein
VSSVGGRLSVRVGATIGCLAMAALGCSKQSTFALTGGRSVAGEVKRSEGDQIVLETDEGEMTVDRRAIEDVTWSGEAATIGGATVLGIGLAGLITTFAFAYSTEFSGNCHGCGPWVILIMGVPPSVAVTGIGTGPLIWGLLRTADDKENAEASRAPEIGMSSLPGTQPPTLQSGLGASW